MRIIAYYRVSTRKQGESGLGLEGQEAAVRQFAEQNNASILASYTEVESGRRSDRPALDQALSHTKFARATLVVAKLDRLSRNVAFLAALMDSGVEFVAVENPHLNRLSIHILAAVAEDEAERISDRTKAAMQAAKRRGVVFGSARPGHWDGKEHIRREAAAKAGAAAAKVHKRIADERYRFLYPTILKMRDEQGMTFQGIADAMNELGHLTAQGARWTATTARRVYLRAKQSGE